LGVAKRKQAKLPQAALKQKTKNRFQASLSGFYIFCFTLMGFGLFFLLR